MKWVSVKEALPQVSGYYFVACTKDGKKKPYHFTCVYYSTVHKKFNCFDEQRIAKQAFDDVSHWMEIPEVNEDDAD